MRHGKAKKFLSWALRLIAAVILLQTLFFKFSGAKESVYIFTALGAEPWGRIGSGVVELVAAVLLLLPATAGVGGLLSLAVISGALASHFTRLGIALPAVGDHGELFGLAVVVFLCSLGVTWLHRNQIFTLAMQFKSAVARRPGYVKPAGPPSLS